MTERTGTPITLDIDGRPTRGYLALPEGRGPWPGVAVIQEWWGLNDNIRAVVDRYAAEGFVALAPDLYFGEEATEPDDARKLAMALQYPDALAVIQTAVDTLVAHDQVAPKRIGVTGFCMGGGLAWHSAVKIDHVGAVAPYYGGGPEMSDAEVARITVPILAIFGELDKGVSPEVGARRAAQMDRAGVANETIIYEGAQHAFFNESRAAYHPEAAGRAWATTVAFFRTALS
jgi:carboxymethylenebutenolidase